MFGKYRYVVKKNNMQFDDAVRKLKKRYPRHKYFMGHGCCDDNMIIDQIKMLNLNYTEFIISEEEYNSFFSQAGYLEQYTDYYKNNIVEKSLEHYLGALFLGLKEKMVFIDIACENSPAADIFSKLYNVTPYKQDIMNEPGINGNVIGSPAENIPLADASCDALLLSCSLEHFENDSDILFFKEAQRILKPGGAVVIVPLYFSQQAFILTDPICAINGDVAFEGNTEIHCLKGWGNRHGRFYSPETLKSRIFETTPGLTYELIQLKNAATIQGAPYARWMLRATKPK